MIPYYLFAGDSILIKCYCCVFHTTSITDLVDYYETHAGEPMYHKHEHVAGDDFDFGATLSLTAYRTSLLFSTQSVVVFFSGWVGGWGLEYF